MSSLAPQHPCSKRSAKPAQRIEVQAVEGAFHVIEIDESDHMRWLASAHADGNDAAYAAAQRSHAAELPLWLPRVAGCKHPLLQALEDRLFSEGVIARCERRPRTVCWHPLQRLGYDACLEYVAGEPVPTGVEGAS
jgi:hypothetical protein